MKKSDINELSRFLNNASYDNSESDITGFPKVGEVYKWTNEFLDIYPKDNLENKKVLTITASGDHALDAIYKGATDIDSIDINIFSKYVSALKIAMIKSFEFNSFFKKYDNFVGDKISNFTYLMKIIDRISEYLSDDEILFWTTYLKQINILKEEHGTIENFFFIHDIFSLKENNIWYEEKGFYELKEKLFDVKIKYHDGDIINVNNFLDDSKYDCVYLSNVLDRIKTDNDIKFKLVKNMFDIMNFGGLIYSYHFNFDDDISFIIDGNYIDTNINCKRKKIIKNYRCFTDAVVTIKK